MWSILPLEVQFRELKYSLLSHHMGGQPHLYLYILKYVSTVSSTTSGPFIA